LIKLAMWVERARQHPFVLFALVAVLAVFWSFLLARPSPFAGQARPSVTTWARATVLSALVLVFVAATSALIGSDSLAVVRVVLVDPITIAITVAVLLDAFEDFRARRQKLVVAWTLHDPHHTDAVQQMLAADGIPAHMSASYLRSLLSFFGPFVPIEVQVPPEHAEAAREKLERLAAEAI
jgi:hypothetical protein